MKTKSQNTFPPHLPSSQAQLHSQFLYLLPPKWHRGTGSGTVVSASHVASATPSSSGGALLTLFPCSSMKSLPQETVLHEVLQHESFPRAAVLHKLPQHWSLPWGAVLQEQSAPAWVSCGVTSPASKPALTWTPLSPRVHKSCQKPAATQASHGVTASFGHIHLLQHGVSSTGCRWISAPPWTSMDCRGTACLPVVFSTGCRGICSSAWSTSPPAFSLTWVSAELLLSHSLTSLSGYNCCCTGFFFPLLKSVIPEA